MALEMNDAYSPQSENNLLSHLRPADIALLQPMFQVWRGAAGAILFEPGDPIDVTYFPCGPSLASFRVVFPDGESVESALIGREGAVGGIVSQGRLPAYTRTVIQNPGAFIRVETAKLEEAKLKSLNVRHIFARYADCLLAQVFQSSACNARHNIEQRTAKWLIAAMERTGDNKVPLTQEQLAGMLGVGRSYVNRVIRKWKFEKILKWRRGELEVSDFYGLKAHQCDCNNTVKAHFDEVLAGTYPAA